LTIIKKKKKQNNYSSFLKVIYNTNKGTKKIFKNKPKEKEI